MVTSEGKVMGVTWFASTATSKAILDSASLSSGSGAWARTTGSPTSMYTLPMGRARLRM